MRSQGYRHLMSPVTVAFLFGLAPALLGGLLRPLWRGGHNEDAWRHQLSLILSGQDYETDDPRPNDPHRPGGDQPSLPS